MHDTYIVEEDGSAVFCDFPHRIQQRKEQEKNDKESPTLPEHKTAVAAEINQAEFEYIFHGDDEDSDTDDMVCEEDFDMEDVM